MLFVTGCVNKQDSSTTCNQNKDSILHDSCCWNSDSLIGNGESEQINNNDNNSDTMESKRLETSKQILKDLNIKFEKRYEGISDRGSYFENDEDAVNAAKAYMTVLGNYMYSHGYKTISKDLFLQRVKYFYFNDSSDDSWLKKIVQVDSLNVGDQLYARSMSLKYCIYLEEHIYDIGGAVEIKGAKYLNDGIDPVVDEPINERMDMESFLNGELVLKKEYGSMDLDRILYTHLFLFNDSKAAKNWLLNNYIDFFFYKIPHYDNDDEINKTKLLYMTKNCTNEYGIISMEPNWTDKSILISYGLLGSNQNMMKLLFEETDKAIIAYENDETVGLNIKAFETISEYFWKVWTVNESMKAHLDSSLNHEIKSSINHEIESLCLFAKMEVSLNKKHCKTKRNGWFNIDCASISYRLLSDEVLKIAKQHNYFGIPNFDEVLTVIEWDKEHDPHGSKINDSPFDYTTLSLKTDER